MSKKPNEKRLNEHQRYEIISKLSITNSPGKWALAQEYIVSSPLQNLRQMTIHDMFK
jgi:hypothetical protein